jgi:orotidine-5'-phosphate decarboxylase
MAELIVALDHPDAAGALALLDQLPGECSVKVGSVLFTRSGPGFVRVLVDAGHPVFLDLKWHDIPNTVAGAVSAAADLGVDMVTVHAAGGRAMLEAAVAAAAAGGKLHVVGVTVLTSLDAAAYREAVGWSGESLDQEVVRLAEEAVAAGLDGVVCSPAALAATAAVVGPGRLVVPGIRRAGDATGDHRRAGDPARAVAQGATHLVVGRPITESADPAASWAAFARLARGGME